MTMRFCLALGFVVCGALRCGFGEEIEGERKAAQTVCPTPEEAREKMSVPEGYEVRCFAHEPMVQNPVAMTWDHRGRLWVVEAYEYPEGSPHPAPFGREVKDDGYRTMPKVEGKTKLGVDVAADDRGDWVMKAVVNGKVVKEMVVDAEKPRWKRVEVDLTAFVGQEVTVRLEAHASGWNWEFAYWHGIGLE
jgi:hypothetical protein